jgi:catechol 2,3-dioxygenase-like lactoylglutathione lyase family enzyme
VPLKFIREAVVAVADLDAAVAFHREAFGFAVVKSSEDTVLLAAPGAESGRLRLHAVAAPQGWEQPQVWDLGPRLLGIYSHDLDATVTAVRVAGGRARTPVTYPYGTASLSELVAYGTDGVWWTVPQAVPGAHRPSDAYAQDSERLHSELHTAVLVVQDHDAAVAFFSAGGLDTVFDGRMAGEPFDALVGMPSDAALRLAFMGGSDHLPARFEIMSFEGVDTVDRTGDPLGVQRLVFVCDDVAGTRAALVAAGAEEVDGATLRGPVGVLLTLVEDDA